MHNIQASLWDTKRRFLPLQIALFGCAFALSFGCATGRALTQEETAELTALEAEKAKLQRAHNKRRNQLDKAIKDISVETTSARAILCGGKPKTLSSGKVQLVYGPKKRVVFSPNGKKTKKGCHELSIKVMP